MGTSSDHKYEEAREVLTEYGVELERLSIDRVEIQADDPELIAEYSLKVLDVDIPILIEDAGLYIDKYYGFPGPYSSYALRTIDNEGILKLMEGETERGARYLSAVAFRDGDTSVTFTGEVVGRIAMETRGTNGFGYDPIFMPEEGDGRTFGEMSAAEKARISHRARAFRKLGEWLRAG
ncbi:RdgB/HAM1 family non-canonical purine NTP pyrophosphatase [Candidatus Bathyarchaeota archaeon]|jgi:XTP/dITP diphosphohydrolase|nr:RdgB/HAM1 family non-canonical purine NTP pyrophosphatase [Candidatus Bathyarchaeota archaeon]